MVADSALVARSGKCPPGFLSAEARIGFEQDRVLENLFPYTPEAFREMTVDFFPMSVVFEGSRRRIRPEVLVEISDGEDPFRPGGAQGIRQTAQAFPGQDAPVGFASELGRVVVHQDGEAVEFGEQDVARLHHGSAAVRQVLGDAAPERQGGATAEQGAVDAAVVGGVIVDDAVVQLSQGGRAQQLPEHEGVLHLGKPDGVRHPAVSVRDAQQGLGDGVALVVKASGRPVFRPVFGVVVKEILHVPEDDQQGVLRRWGL